MQKKFVGMLILTVIIAAITITAYLSYDYLNSSIDSSSSVEIDCKSDMSAKNHLFVIEDSKFSPSSSSVDICDTITVTNNDDMARFMTFGEHDQHVHYDGIESVMLEHEKSFTFTVSAAGDIRLHDHNNDEVSLELKALAAQSN